MPKSTKPPSNAGQLPDLAMSGEGTVTPGGRPAKSPDERHAYHTALFLERGLSKTEAKRLADAVIARDASPVSHPPLKLSE